MLVFQSKGEDMKTSLSWIRKYIGEASYDRTWGNVVTMDIPQACKPSLWTDANSMGKLVYKLQNEIS